MGDKYMLSTFRDASLKSKPGALRIRCFTTLYEMGLCNVEAALWLVHPFVILRISFRNTKSPTAPLPVTEAFQPVLWTLVHWLNSDQRKPVDNNSFQFCKEENAHMWVCLCVCGVLSEYNSLCCGLPVLINCVILVLYYVIRRSNQIP